MTPAATREVQTHEAARAPKLRVETVSTYQGFLNLEPAWNQLVKDAEMDHPFLEFIWARTWWECFGGGNGLHVLVVRELGDIVAIAPLISTSIRMFGIPVRRLGFFYNSHVPRADFLIAKRSDEAYQAIWEHLLRTRQSWDLLQLCQLREGPGTLEEMSNLASEEEFPSGTWVSGASPIVDLDTSWNEYFQNLPSKHRSNLRNRFKRLNQTGMVALETVTQPESLPNALEAGFQLEESAWKRDAGTAISCDPNVRRFYEILACRATAKNWLQLNFLGAGGQRVAFDYSLRYRGQIFLLKLGYDPAFSAYSPSNLLLSKALERAFEDGLAKYDFLGEEAPWKSCWTETSKPNYWLFVFSRSFKGRCLHFLKFGVTPWLKSWSKREKPEAAA